MSQLERRRKRESQQRASTGRPAGTPGRSGKWLLAAVAALLVVAAGFHASRSYLRAPVPEPPLPPATSELDPAVAELLATMRDGVMQDRRNAEAWRELGLAYDANAVAESARTCLEQAVLLAPDDARAWFHLGRVRAEAMETEPALEAFDKSRELDARYAPTSWRAGFVMLEANDLEGARAAFERALAVDPKSIPATAGLTRVALAKNDGATAELLIRPLATARPKDEALRFLLGSALRMQGRLEEADAGLRTGTATTTQWHDPWELGALRYQVSTFGLINQALAASADGHHDFAARTLEKLLVREPDVASVSVNLASEYIALSKPQEAIRVLRSLLAKQPDLAVAHAGFAEAALAAKDYAATVMHAGRALALDPNLPRLHEFRGAAFAAMARHADAADAFRKAIAAAPLDANVHFGLGAALMQLNLPEDALPELREAVRLEPDRGQFHLALGVTALALSRFDEAEAAFRKAGALGAMSPSDLTNALAQVRSKRAGGARP